MAGLNTPYLSSNRGIIKILQIILGLITSSLLCIRTAYGSCFYYEGRYGYVSSLNTVIVIINIIFFVLNLISITEYRVERLYAVIGIVLFVIAFALMIWLAIDHHYTHGRHLVATVLIGLQMGLFIWDYRILTGQAFN